MWYSEATAMIPVAEHKIMFWRSHIYGMTNKYGIASVFRIIFPDFWMPSSDSGQHNIQQYCHLISALVLFHCGLVTPHVTLSQGMPVKWRHQASSHTNVAFSSMKFCDTDLKPNWQEVLETSIHKMIAKNTLVKLLAHFSGANPLNCAICMRNVTLYVIFVEETW